MRDEDDARCDSTPKQENGPASQEHAQNFLIFKGEEGALNVLQTFLSVISGLWGEKPPMACRRIGSAGFLITDRNVCNTLVRGVGGIHFPWHLLPK